jgi:hypothetical protein
MLPALKVAVDVIEEATPRRATMTVLPTVGSGEHGKIATGIGTNPGNSLGLVDLCPTLGSHQ